MPKTVSKSQLTQKIADQHSKRHDAKKTKGLIESLAKIGNAELSATCFSPPIKRRDFGVIDKVIEQRLEMPPTKRNR
jgi:hypothetical protein